MSCDDCTVCLIKAATKTNASVVMTVNLSDSVVREPLKR